MVREWRRNPGDCLKAGGNCGFFGAASSRNKKNGPRLGFRTPQARWQLWILSQSLELGNQYSGVERARRLAAVDPREGQVFGCTRCATGLHRLDRPDFSSNLRGLIVCGLLVCSGDWVIKGYLSSRVSRFNMFPEITF